MRSRYYAINIDITSNIPFEEHAVKSRLGDIDQAPPLYPPGSGNGGWRLTAVDWGDPFISKIL